MNSSKTRTAALGLQHVLAMYAGAMIIPLVVGGALKLSGAQLTYLISIDMFMCGIATLLQVWKNKFSGIGLPIVLGCTFTAATPMIMIGGQYGIRSVYGAVLVSGIIVLLISKWFGKLSRFFPPLVTGSVVMIIGITLIPSAFNNMAGGEGAADFASLSNLCLSFGTLIFILILYKFFTGFIQSVAILLGIILGTGAGWVMGKVDFSAVGEASWFHLPQFFYFGTPVFDWTAIITMTLVAIVSLVESTGVYYALGDICGRKITKEDLAKGYRAEGIATILGALFNAFPYTAYSQNVGLLQLSGAKSKNIIYTAGVMLAVIGLVPKIAAFTTIIPSSVLGGAMLAMFGMVCAYGIKMLSSVDFSSQENLLVIACSVGMGMGVTVVPSLFSSLPDGLQILTGNGIVAGSLTAIVLNIAFNMLPVKTGMVVEAKMGRRKVS